MAIRQRNRTRRGICIVSACLAGFACTWRASHKLDPQIRYLVESGRALAVCPEIMGGLPTPRVPAELSGADGGDVLRGKARATASDGRDLTASYLRGARAVLGIAQRAGARRAILKTKSPACGCGAIYDGTFTRTLRPGRGILAALLLDHGFTVSSR